MYDEKLTTGGPNENNTITRFGLIDNDSAETVHKV